MRRLLLLLVVASCARGRNDPPEIDAAGTPPMPDAPASSMGTDAPVGGSGCTATFTGTLATWSFTGEPGNQTMTAVTSKATGITAGAVTRSAALTAVTGAGSINSSNWPTAAMRDTTKYYALTITPPAGCKLSLMSAAIDAKSSGTGPVTGVLSTSADNYSATTNVSTAAPGAVPLTIANATAMVEVRIYGYSATGTGGTLRVQNTLSLDGKLE